MKTRYLNKKVGAINLLMNPKPAKIFVRILIGLHLFAIVILFMPWTQNVRAKGTLTTRNPYDRPQDVTSRIDGRIEKWYVKEGDEVKKGDTIVFISEIKDAYFDEKLLDRTKEQLRAKEGLVEAYKNKIDVLSKQADVEKLNLQLKLSQARNKVIIAKQKVSIDSSEVVNAEVASKTANDQYLRAEKMYSQDGIISLKDLEDRRVKLAETQNKLISAQNKYGNSKQDYINSRIELNTIEADYNSKIFKIESDIQSAMSDGFKGQEDYAKLQNQYANYAFRVENRYVLAPKDGQIVKIFKQGVGENVKQGEAIASITSKDAEYAVELYIDPIDMPLMKLGKKVRVFFDGWPTIVFSGWPGASYGTFGAIITGMDSDISKNGKYRILVSPDPNDIPWPKELRVGVGAQGIALLNDVRVWYELWRQINGFPPDFYQPEDKGKDKSDKKSMKDEE